MKKLVLILAVLVIAAPAMAVTLSLDNGGDADGWVSINYDKGAGVMPRAFALEVSVDVGNITAYADSVSDASIEPFNVYMGNIQIDGGVIVSRGSPVAPASAPDTPGQLGTSSIIIEMGSLYVPGTSDPCEPATSGTLIKLLCSDCDAVMTVTSNALRGNVVLEDTTVVTPGTSDDVCTTDCYTGPEAAQWELVGKPDGWCSSNIPRQCHCDTDNLSYGKNNYWCSSDDLGVLLAAWNKTFAQIDGLTYSGAPPYTNIPLINADFDHLPYGKNNYRVASPDLGILLGNWNLANLPLPNCP